MRDILICFFDKYNGASIYAAINIRPKKIVFIGENKDNFLEEVDNISSYLSIRLPELLVERTILKERDYYELRGIINEYPRGSTLINLSSGHRLITIMAYKLCLEEGYKSIFAEPEEDFLLDLSSEDIQPLKDIERDMSVRDLIAGAGGESLRDSSELFKDEKVKAMTEYIVKNYALWKKVKKLLRNNFYIEYSVDEPMKVKINIALIRNYSFYESFFQKGQELGLYRLEKEEGDYLILEFDDIRYKSFLFKTGTWLEAMVYNLISGLKQMDDVRGGVVFLWDREKERIKNEADVLATSNSKLIYISCKDTSHYDESTLNELEVYGNKIGGENTVKILAVTSIPIKSTIMQRAEEMGIKVLVFEGDIGGFRQKLSKVLKID